MFQKYAPCGNIGRSSRLTKLAPARMGVSELLPLPPGRALATLYFAHMCEKYGPGRNFGRTSRLTDFGDGRGCALAALYFAHLCEK